MAAEACAQVNLPHQGRRKMGKGKWMHGTFKAFANTAVFLLHRAFGLFGVSGMSLLSAALTALWAVGSNSTWM